jgi:predicted nucleic acid-binding protein
MRTIFIDTFCLIASSVQRDANHLRVHTVMQTLEQANARFVTTDAVLVEFCNALSKAALRSIAASTVRLLRARDDIDIVHITREIFDRALILYETRSDKDWGLTDCMSFEVMKSQRIKDALTGDHHFAQAGFKTLM